MVSFVIVAARYKEDVSWLRPFAPNIYIQNKGDIKTIPKDLQKFSHEVTSNIGLDQYCHLSYIVNNYHVLPEVVMFTQGCIRDHRDVFETRLYDDVLKVCDTSRDEYTSIVPINQIVTEMIGQANVFGYSLNAANYVRAPWGLREGARVLSLSSYDFRLDGPENTMDMCFGEWFEKFVERPFPKRNEFVWFKNAIFAVRSSYITKRPLEYYKRLLSQITQPWQDVLHFVERSWVYMLQLHRNVCNGPMHVVLSNWHLLTALDPTLNKVGVVERYANVLHILQKNTQETQHVLHVGIGTGVSAALLLLANTNIRMTLITHGDHRCDSVIKFLIEYFRHRLKCVSSIGNVCQKDNNVDVVYMHTSAVEDCIMSKPLVSKVDHRLVISNDEVARVCEKSKICRPLRGDEKDFWYMPFGRLPEYIGKYTSVLDDDADAVSKID